MQCRDLRDIADSYLSDELLVETNHDVINHLENCSDCRQELAARREMRTRLRSGFANAPDLQMRDEFGSELRDHLRTLRPLVSHLSFTTRHRGRWLALAASLVIISSIGLSVLMRNQRERSSQSPAGTSTQIPKQVPSQVIATEADNRIMALNTAVAELAGSAVGDHKNCAVEFRLAKPPVDLEKAGQTYDHAYINLTKAVMSSQENSADPWTLDHAHFCIFAGRRYAHVILRYHGQIVSLLVTTLDGAEAATQSPRTTPQTTSTPDQLALASSHIEGNEVCYFRTTRHCVFVVSRMQQAENLNLARQLAPAISAHLTRTEI
ncbi:MAG: anti-sigma factor family protein [Pyrinomonadaceae bacterium]